MREIKQRAPFRRDLKRELRGVYSGVLQKGGELEHIAALLRNDIPLPPKYRDHQLRGKWEGCRECHIRPDLLLVYRYEGDWLVLERLGSHAEIFGL